LCLIIKGLVVGARSGARLVSSLVIFPNFV
jgi:hypothetical protein